jgi:Na+-transporting NADH:ubiquinone oxidoreductase subunit A
MPGLQKYSLSNAFLSKIFSNKNSKLTTKKNGSVRTIIPMGNWDNVLPMDILSEFLVKNILANDIDMMEKLGIYECSPEDFALCAFICQSKVEVSAIIEKGLDAMEAEE